MKRVVQKKHDTDLLMKKLVSHLAADFCAPDVSPAFCLNFTNALHNGDVAGFRKVCEDTVLDYTESPAVFKRKYQLISILKRYRFKNDLYSDSELKDLSIRKFLDIQDHLAAFEDLDGCDAITQLCLDSAAEWIHQVIGEFDHSECYERAQHGRKASVGVPSRKACLAERFVVPISGTREQISWFLPVMEEAPLLQDFVEEQLKSDPLGPIYQETSRLSLTFVPKSYKSLRSIMPNTTIGSFQSYGVGDMIRVRLRKAGYNISTLQSRHRKLAQDSSVTGKNVTMDLSSASDCITRSLVRRLLPASWFVFLDNHRVETVELPDKTSVFSRTFCTMGIGYTFPLQTLIFLSLIHAVRKLISRNPRLTISVYGDDMIFDRSLYECVWILLSKVGFIVNEDKTFYDGPFRESCGGDYYRGVDVRPFSPQGGSQTLSRISYESLLYKTINGLLHRWSEHEIPLTLKFLTSQLSTVVHNYKIVPSDFSDDAGIKSITPRPSFEFLRGHALCKPKMVTHGIFRFLYLRLEPAVKEEKRHGPYLHESLRNANRRLDRFDHSCNLDVRSTPVVDLVESLTGITSVGEPIFTQKISSTETVRSKISGRRMRRVHTMLPVMDSGVYKRQSGTSNFCVP